MEIITALITTLVFISILGIIVAFSPTLVVTELAILTRSKNSAIQSVAFIAGIALAIALFCAVALLFVDPSKEFTLPSTREVIHSVPLTDIIIGSLLIFVGFRVAEAKPNKQKKPSRFKPENLLSTKTLFWFGFIKMATSLSSIAAILLAARFINTSIDAGSLQIASIVWLVAVAVFPFILILLLQQYRPDSFARIQRASDKAASLNWRRIIAFTLVIGGCYFVINGILHFG